MGNLHLSFLLARCIQVHNSFYLFFYSAGDFSQYLHCWEYLVHCERQQTQEQVRKLSLSLMARGLWHIPAQQWTIMSFCHGIRVYNHTTIHVCVCVCVWERERESICKMTTPQISQNKMKGNKRFFFRVYFLILVSMYKITHFSYRLPHIIVNLKENRHIWENRLHLLPAPCHD